MATVTKTKLQNFIDGEFVDAAEGATEEVTNPANGEVIAEMQLSNEEDVNRAVAAAKAAFPGWSTTPPAERAAAIMKLADLLEEHAEEMADLEAADAGKPRNAFLEDEMPFLCDNLRFFAGAGRVLEGKSAGEYVENRTSLIRREPVGVVGQIAPWNYPLMMAIWKIGPALATGCTIVLKPAETTPVSTVKLAEYEDVDPEVAMETIAATALYNAGQDCTASTRGRAAGKVYDDVVNGLAEESKGYKMGDTLDPETTLGPLNSRRQR